MAIRGEVDINGWKRGEPLAKVEPHRYFVAGAFSTVGLDLELTLRLV